MFQCDRCGLCCMDLNKSELTKDFHKGDGICIHLDREKMMCQIYEDRPYFCRIDEGYDNYFKDTMPKEEFYRLNYEACEEKKQRWIACGKDFSKFGDDNLQLPPDYEEVLAEKMDELIRKSMEQ